MAFEICFIKRDAIRLFMAFDVVSYYSYLLISLGLLLALYTQLKGITTPLSKPKDGIHSIKWSQYGWFSFFVLTFMGALIPLLESFDILNYRIVWVYSKPILAPTIDSISNFITILIDSFLIFFCFVSLFIGIKRVGMRSSQPKAGRFEYRLNSGGELVIFLLGSYFFFPLFSLLMISIGVSFLLIILYMLILFPLFFVIVKYGVPY